VISCKDHICRLLKSLGSSTPNGIVYDISYDPLNSCLSGKRSIGNCGKELLIFLTQSRSIQENQLYDNTPLKALILGEMAERVRIRAPNPCINRFFASFHGIVAKKTDYPRQVANIRYCSAVLLIPDIILLLHYG